MGYLALLVGAVSEQAAVDASTPSGGTLLLIVGLATLVLGLAASALGAWIASRSLRRAREDAATLESAALAAAEKKAAAVIRESEERASERRAASERDLAEAKEAFKEVQGRAHALQASIEQQLDRLGQREQKLDERESSLEAARASLEAAQAAAAAAIAAARAKLSDVAQLPREEARALVLAEAREEAQSAADELALKLIHDAEVRAEERSREILLQSIQRYASETVSENTLKSVKVASEELKGRLIGREGRNIRAIERATGVDIIIDDTPGVVGVSCFDKVRQAVAAESLQKLLADGRIHPARIEEVVESTKKEMEARILRGGGEAAMEAHVRGLHPRILEALGRLGFRTSYGQNVLRHSIEVAFLSQIIADQLGLDGETARRCGLLHDIGKALDQEVSGTHPAIGADFLQRHGEKSEAVLNATAGHHGDIASTTPYTPIVMAADALSGARPGARRDSMEQYVKRLRQLEELALCEKGVQEAFAIQAGREVRVIIDAANSDDAAAHAIAGRIAKRVETEMTFPGEIKVTVLREVRAEALAR